MARRGIYSTEGEAVYDLDGRRVGTIEADAIRDLDGATVWKIEGDGLYATGGRVIGYLGSRMRDEDEPSDRL
jgi:hypothetical protein